MDPCNTIQKTKDTLHLYNVWKKKAKLLQYEIDDLEREINELPAVGISSTNPGPGRKNAGTSQSQQERYIQHQELLSDKLQQKRLELLEVKRLIQSVSRAVHLLDDTQQIIITARYIDRLTWDATARRTLASVTYCRKYADIAIKTLSVMLYQ